MNSNCSNEQTGTESNPPGDQTDLLTRISGAFSGAIFGLVVAIAISIGFMGQLFVAPVVYGLSIAGALLGFAFPKPIIVVVTLLSAFIPSS